MSCNYYIFFGICIYTATCNYDKDGVGIAGCVISLGGVELSVSGVSMGLVRSFFVCDLDVNFRRDCWHFGSVERFAISREGT